jgi:AraC-like DNA-binding protein
VNTDFSNIRSTQSRLYVTGIPGFIESHDPYSRDHANDPSRTEELIASAHEDIARLAHILGPQRYIAAIRGVERTGLPPEASACRISDGGRSGALALSAPVYDADGRTLASLEVRHDGKEDSDTSQGLLRALVESAAQSISERWFRYVHRRHWIVAALRRSAPHSCVILALDRDRRIVGAERRARQFLEHKGRRFEKHLPLSEFFDSVPTLLRRRGDSDVSLTLRGSADGETWVALLTPPDPAAGCPVHDTRTLLHIRPRLESLTRLLFEAPDATPRFGLSRSSLKRIEAYVEANLGSSLDIDNLSSLVRMSSSHFIRSFQRAVGMTPHRYVIRCRVAKARELLTTTDLPLIEIALATGFSDQSHFTRRFQESAGVPPGAYRRTDAGVRTA